ncbi:SDR family oxidoreductase [Stutzerimonas nitrititolerans]|uniref:SDR family oxidoreductase n=1 Tax=Stutzerimonas nitrititolerans TaxID=2482751 RepID=UPI0028AC95F1|nr:SDR family oxidoreductase [Stutzerimonas nitrititolerans]
MSTVLITGGTGKFGSVLVEHFCLKGMQVVFTSTSAEKIAEIVGAYAFKGKSIVGIQVDFSVENSVQSVIQDLLLNDISVDYLVNNARSLASLAIEPDGSVARKNFLDEYLLDVVVPYELTVALAKLGASRLKSVVNIGSQYGMVAANPALYTDHARQSPIQYGVAKAALVHLTKELAVRLAEQKIRVNCVAYGGVEGRVDEAFKARYATLVPNQRMLCEAEIPGPIEFLLSEASSAMTGQVICADGGWTIW